MDLNGEQLRMFMTAREIHDNYAPIDAIDQIPGHPMTWAMKYREALEPDQYEKTALADSVREHGVRQPVQLGDDYVPGEEDRQPAVLGGHHRIAVEYAERPDTRYIPVTHHEGFSSAVDDTDMHFGGYDRYHWSTDPRGRGYRYP